MKRIIVPCDFSKPAVNAFRLALDIASISKGSVHLLHVIELPVLHDTMIMPVLSFEEEFIKDWKQKVDEKFRKLIAKYKTEDVKVVSEVKFGPVTSTILDYIADNSIDLVLMGSHGAQGLKEMFIGSNAEKLVRNSPVPVLVTKDFYKGPIKNIVFPNTLSTEDQEDLVRNVKLLQDFFNARLHIVWVNTLSNFTPDHITRLRLEAFAKRFMLKNYTINIFNHVYEEEGILQFTKQIKGDLIAMGTHSRKGLAHFINGSLAEDIVNHTDSLIWTYTLKNEPKTRS